MLRRGERTDITPEVQALVERVIARTRANLAAGLPIDAGADARQTCADLGIPYDEEGRNRARGFYKRRVPTILDETMSEE